MVAGLAPGPSGGDPSGVPTIDSAAFPFAYYRALITNRLRAVWSRPVVPGGLTAPLRVTIHFEILRAGALADIALASTSGHPPLDRSALRAAYDANPLPPLPDEFEGDRLAVNFYFELRPEP
jgi:TonB family protein